MLFPDYMVSVGRNTLSGKLNVKKVHIFKNACRDSSSLTLIEIFQFIITSTQIQSKRSKIIVQGIMYDRKINGSYLSIRVHLYKNLKPKSSMPLPPDLDSLAV